MLNFKYKTPLYNLDNGTNRLFVKRDDLLPFSFGGNKARKALLFWRDYENSGCDCFVTYGSSSSNHCRIIANIAASLQVDCYIISPTCASEDTYNSKLMKMFGAHILCVDVQDVHEIIDNTLLKLRALGKKPYFIPGGGHGNIGTQAYVDCYQEILDYEVTNNVYFDYVFHASGTGTTQAGLVAGQILNKDDRHIVGISVARSNPRGLDIVKQSIKDYLDYIGFGYSDSIINSTLNFNDEYISGGYGKDNNEIDCLIKRVMINYGIPLDKTYTGKAWWGMHNYLIKNNIENKNILFIHTGGTPLFFDSI